MGTVDGLQLRRVLGRKQWLPAELHGPDGWRLDAADGDGTVLVTAAPLSAEILPYMGPSGVALSGYLDGDQLVHASMSRRGRIPDYAELCRLHRAVWGEGGYAYQVHAPAAEHVNVAEHALHLWGLASGRPILPEWPRLFGGVCV